MKLALITYNTRHLKTEQVALGLTALGMAGLSFFALPFKPRPARAVQFAHRPVMAEGAHPAAVAAAVEAPFTAVSGPDAIPIAGFDYYIITGAGLLPASFVEATAGKVINSHAGMIPLVRGLDAFKWAIIDQMPIGNTLHFIDAEADAGKVFAQAPTPLFETDTLDSFARRHYECEIDMMIGFNHYLSQECSATDMARARPARKRMPSEVETGLTHAFDVYKTRFAIHPR